MNAMTMTSFNPYGLRPGEISSGVSSVTCFDFNINPSSLLDNYYGSRF